MRRSVRELFETEKTKYDFFGDPPKVLDKRDNIMLTYTGNKAEVALLPQDGLKTFMWMGEQGYLKGVALEAYQKAKEGNEDSTDRNSTDPVSQLPILAGDEGDKQDPVPVGRE